MENFIKIYVYYPSNIPPQALAEKWSFMKDGDRKKFEKKKEFRNVEEFKKENEKYSKYDIKKFNNQYSEPTTEKFLKNEVCILIPSVSAIQFYFLLFF